MLHYSDISERVEIIGKLRQPLNQLVTVRGRWTAPFPSSPASPVFMVNQVNGGLLDQTAKFDDVEPVWDKVAAFAKKTVSEEWELRGVETGGFVGFSDKVWEELGQPPKKRLPRGFLTRFCYVKATRVSASKPAASGKSAFKRPDTARWLKASPVLFPVETLTGQNTCPLLPAQAGGIVVLPPAWKSGP